MKKIILMAAVAGFAMASCAKDRTCECNVTPTSGQAYTYTIKMYDAKKKHAREACYASLGGKETTVSGSNTTTGDDWKCELK
jgi:hypothetical protein